jgi:uncharacterized protein
MIARAGIMALFAAVLLLPGRLFAVPPPVQQLTADCAAPVYASDQLVCEDPELRMLDARMAELLYPAPGELPEASVEGEQAEWFRQSRMCAFEPNHRECLVRAYCARLKQLTSASHAGAIDWSVCPDSADPQKKPGKSILPIALSAAPNPLLVQAEHLRPALSVHRNSETLLVSAIDFILVPAGVGVVVDGRAVRLQLLQDRQQVVLDDLLVC